MGHSAIMGQIGPIDVESGPKYLDPIPDLILLNLLGYSYFCESLEW